MRKYKAENDGRRMFLDGVLRVNSIDEGKNYKVSLMLLNGKRNRNGWVYENIRAHLSEFEEIPLLCAWVAGKPDGHNFDVKVDPKTGKKYASFLGADAEKIIGWIAKKTPSGEDNVYLTNIDGVEWVCVREALIPSFYNKEFIDALEKNGGEMKVSIETIVQKNRVEDDTEYEEEWEVIGVTVISVMEAVAGAKIKRKVNAYSDELEEMKLRAAQYYAKDDKEPQTQKKQKTKQGEGKAMKFLNVGEAKEKFSPLGYDVLAVNGMTVAMLSENGQACNYTFQENESTIVPERIERVTANSVFGEGDNAVTVTADELLGALQAKLNAANAALKDKTAEAAQLAEKLNQMEEAEKARRKEAVKSAIKEQLADRLNSCGVVFADTICNDMLAEDCVNKYAGMTDANGCFIGESVARRDVDSRCMAEVCKANEAKRAAQKTQFAWASAATPKTSGEGGLQKLYNKFNHN